MYILRGRHSQNYILYKHLFNFIKIALFNLFLYFPNEEAVNFEPKHFI